MCFIFISIKYAFKILLSNSLQLTDLIITWYPCMKTWSIAFLTAIASLFLIGTTQAYFEKLSEQVSK